MPNSDQEHTAVTKAFAVDGSTEVATLCSGYCMFDWDTTGNSHSFEFPELFED